MKKFAILFLFAAALMAFGEEDGKYRPTEAAQTTTIARAFPTTTRAPVYKVNDPRYDQRWNSGRYWPNDRYDPRYDVTSRFDTRLNPVANPIGRPYVPRGYHDYRTIRLDEKVDAKGYQYTYETVGGILAEEVGVFENIGLKVEGVRIQGYVQITDPQGVVYRIDYQTEGKEAYIPPRGETPRIPPTIVKLLALLETHK